MRIYDSARFKICIATMFDNLPDNITTGILIIISGAVGGLARLAISVKNEFFIWMVVSLPFSVMTGFYAYQEGFGFYAVAIAYFAGILALATVRIIVKNGSKIISVISDDLIKRFKK